ncbi:hypothetical protein BC939DRAFT_105706 [Gamsiella multidivaricata]|uniref:uncharacterized protein n=1 Tax=Gamsiella multidivaricata TaxID=101098 RepID=UPI00221F5A31|nr:uncharacterized protein BC939DRAFT_105706 [Gamsiella multidivaricata]KAG0358620.1 hypothetical protein BGZ54_010348 [Gamsiella multidivaricata]KAI7832506.1 hypothetical protein BC939DRAFT_105706 [Gamsiella multidivaricata]
MATIDFSMFDTTNVKMSKSADALESALAQLSKNTSFGNDCSSGDLFVPSPNTGNGFDEWLAADLAFSALSSDESSSGSSSPFSALEDSPVLGFDSFGSSVGPSLFDISMGLPTVSFSSELPASPVQTNAPASPVLPMLTSTAVQQAAAALNIPWSAELESAVMAQAVLGAAAPVSAMPAAQPIASPVLAPKAEPVEKGFPSASSSPAVSRAVSAEPEADSLPAVDASTTPVSRKSKKRQLTPEEEAEEIVAKRAKNTDAARRSRLKKLIRLEGLEAKVSDLEAANNALNMKIAILETEKNGFLTKDTEQTARIAQLEAQLAEAHAALTSRA